MKKNNFFVLFFCGLTCLIAGGCAKTEIKNVGSFGKTIVCFGDSLTIGYGALAGEDYPSIMAKSVDMPVVNLGVDADTTFLALNRLEREVVTKDPYLVIVEFCGNDFIKKVPFEATINNLRQIIRYCQKSGAMVALVDISAGPFLSEYRVAYKKLAREEGAIFIPAILSGILTNPSMKSDFLHPNASGYKVIAERILRAIKPYLKESGAK